MVKRSFKSTDTRRFESVRECLETAIKEEGITKCYYDFTEDGNCAFDLFDSTCVHVVDPKEMVRVAEKFFNEFDWVHFDAIGKNGETYISCYLDEDTQESLAEKLIKKDEERKKKLFEEFKKNKGIEGYKKLLHAIRFEQEWKEK